MTDQKSPADVLLVPKSGFDFLEGRFRATAKLRMLNVITAAVLAVVVAVWVIAALAGTLAAGIVEGGLEDLESEQRAVTRELTELQKGASGATEAEVQRHVAQRAERAATILQNQVDYRTVLDAILALPGVTVESVQFDRAEEAGDAAIASVAVTGTAPGTSEATAATEALSDTSRFPFLVSSGEVGSAQCSGGSQGVDRVCTWAWRGTVTDAARGARGKEIETRFQVEPVAPPTELPQGGSGGGGG